MSSSWRTLDRGTIHDIALVCLADSLVGASFGAISVSGGLPAWVPIALSVLVFAGGSQFAAVGVLLAGGGPLAAVATGLVLNTRLLPLGFAVGDVLGGPRWSRLLGAHLLTDESAAFALRHQDPARRRAAFWLCGLALFACWNLSVVLGAVAGGAIGDTAALGLDAAFPTVLLALLLPALADRATRNATFLGAAAALAATPFLPPGLPVLLALVGLLPALLTRPATAERATAADRATAPDRSAVTAPAAAPAPEAPRCP
ncbi:AzlC family ABC transporter permease [Kitasatospora sp. NPDC094015]|uniref:AzlC family ABC transporter permease n=1 Tax=Kitasatospora sp. NPDC094015 TaxID=3155205 RepID=UPI00332BFDB9